MGTKVQCIKYTVTAFCVGVWFSLPLPVFADVLDDLYDRLAQADAGQAPRIEGQIQTEWSKSGSPAMDLLLQRGYDAIEDGRPEVAIEHFTALIDHAPNFAEAYHGRATAYYLTGRYGPALDDLAHALDLNPRHFGAMRGFAVMLEELGRPEEALEVYKAALEIHPHLESVPESVARLEAELGGQPL